MDIGGGAAERLCSVTSGPQARTGPNPITGIARKQHDVAGG